MEKLTYTHNDAAAKALAAFYETPPLAYVRSYGCQQNVNDGEKIKGVLQDVGYGLCDNVEHADLILFNTCAVREHAEQRVFGNVGALKGLKEKKPGLIIGLCGCMANQKHVVEKLRKSYPYVDLVFGVDGIDTLPQLVAQKLQKHKRVLLDPAQRPVIVENIPIRRESEFRAWLPIMYGCDNFCTYCIVPYVRGRERSREPEKIIEECRGLIAEGYKEITLLGQNVNSYGKDLGTDYDFADLLAAINAIPGDYWLRFMSSQPKDATNKLFDTMARCEHVAKQLHLPVQSGCDRVLKAMNRPYTRAKYEEMIAYARSVMPGMVLTSDVIIGFPGETEDEAMQTVDLVEKTQFDALFTFIFSPRPGTPAAKMDDPVSREEKQVWFEKLVDAQNAISAKKHAAYIGRTVKVLVDGESDDEAFAIWRDEIGIPEDRIFRFGKEDNFWEHGAGPCGPCSEIYYDRGEKYGCGKPGCTVGCDCDRYMEVWNNVFTQFENDGEGHYETLKQKNIDTGMGLERLAVVVQDVDSIFDVDTLCALRNKVCEVAGKTYGVNHEAVSYTHLTLPTT